MTKLNGLKTKYKLNYISMEKGEETIKVTISKIYGDYEESHTNVIPLEEEEKMDVHVEYMVGVLDSKYEKNEE